MHAFDNANNFVIQNLNQTESRRSDVNEFKLLQDHVVTGAAHNSGERYDAPKCHPKTRTAVLTNIKSWLDSSDDKKRVMWLHGPAGAGKSAIAQTTADDCERENKLAASFFFSRPAGRNKKNGLVATIAYQLCVSIPSIKEHIVENINWNPQLFAADIKTQIKWLVVEPLSQVYHSGTIGAFPRLIIIDGLDECEIKRDQAEIIESFSTSVSVASSTGLRVLLVSRPELEIRRAFNKDNISPLCIKLALDDSFNPDNDIELYLRSHFQIIKRQHTLGELLPHSWPSDDSVKKLVAKASGQFIYASTVIYFICDPEHDPRKRLDTILQIRSVGNDDKPYAQLDALYSAVLSMCKDYTKVTAIFEAIMFLVDNKYHSYSMLTSVEDLEIFLSLKDELLLLLANLHSIVDVNNIQKVGVRFYHASLFDYLVDSSRSHGFHIDKREGHVNLSLKCFHFLLHLPSDFTSVVFEFCREQCFRHFVKSGCDNRVFDYICKMRILEPNNGQLEQAIQASLDRQVRPLEKFQTYAISIQCTSMLSYLIASTGFKEGQYRRVDVTESARNITDAEVLNHLENYPRQDILYMLFFEALATGRGSITYKLHANFTKTFKPGYTSTSIMRSDIFLNPDVRTYFLDLMRDTGYIDKISDDITVKAIFCVLGLALEEKGTELKYIQLLLKRICANLPLSKEIYRALLAKWNILNNQLLSLHGKDVVFKVESYIRSYCMRVKKDAQNNFLFANSRMPKLAIRL